MTKQEVLNWLKANKKYIKVSTIGRDAGVPHIRHIIGEYKSGSGHTTELGDQYVPELSRIINQIQKPPHTPNPFRADS